MRKIVFPLCAFLFIGATLQAQDKIYRKNGEVLKVKIIEIGTSEIKYKLFGKDDSPIYVLERDRIKKIVYEDGKTENTTVDLKDPEQYADQRTKAIKFNFFGPLMGYSQFSFEKSTGVGKAYEVGLAVIGAGKNQQLDRYDFYSLRTKKRDQFGVALSAGYKFNKLPDFMFGRTRFTHIMQGGYLKPTVYLGNYAENQIVYKANSQYVVERQNITFAAIQLELGKQWVFGDQFVLDVYSGMGYGFDNKKTASFDDEDLTAYNYLNARIGRSPGLSFNWSIKIGMLLK